MDTMASWMMKSTMEQSWLAEVNQLHIKHFNATDLTNVSFSQQTFMNYTSLKHVQA